MVAVKTGFPSPPMPGMPAPMQPMGGLPPMPPMGGPGSFPQPMGGGNPFAPMPPMPLAGMPPPPPMMQPPMPQQQQGSNAPRRKRFGDSLESMLGRNQGLGAPTPQQRPLPMPPQMMPQQRMVAPGVPMMATPTPRPMEMGGEVDIFGYEDGGSVQYFDAGGHAHPHSGGGVDADIANAYIQNMVAGRDDLSAEDKVEFAQSLASQFGVEGGSGVQAALDNLAGEQVDLILDDSLSMVARYGDVNAANDVVQEVEVHAGTSPQNTFADGSYFDTESNTYIKEDGTFTSPTVTEGGGGINNLEYFTDENLVQLANSFKYMDADTNQALINSMRDKGVLDKFIALNTAAGTDLTNINTAIDIIDTTDKTITNTNTNTNTTNTNTNNTGTDGVLNINMGGDNASTVGSTSTALPSTLDNTALFGVSTNIPDQTVSQYVQDPNTFQMTATPSSYMTAASPMGSISLPARPMDINIGNYLSDPAYGSIQPYTETPASCAAKGMQYDPASKLCVPMTGTVGMEMGGAVPMQTSIAGQPHMLSYINQDEEALLRSFGGSGIAGPGGIPSYPPTGVTSSGGASDAPKTFDSGYKAITTNYKDDDDNDKTYTDTSTITGIEDASGQDYDGDGNIGGGSTDGGSTGGGSTDGGSTGGGSTGGGSTPVVYRDMYGRRYGSQAEADAANRIIAQQQSDTPDRTIDKAIAGPDLAYDDALSLTQGVIPPQFSGAVPPESQFSYGNIGGIYANDSDASFGFNLPPAVIEPDTSQTGLFRDVLIDPESTSFLPDIINLDAPTGGTGTTTTTFPTGGPGTFGSTGLPAAPDANTTSGIQPASSTTAQNLNQGLGSENVVKPKPRPTTGNQNASNTNTGNQNASNTNTGNQNASNTNTLTPEELEKLKASLGEQVPISGVEKVFNQVIGSAFFGLGSGLADKLKASSEGERQAIVDQHLDALNSGATPVYDDKGEYVGFDMSTMNTFADKVLGADDISVFLPGGSADADGDGIIDSDRFNQVFDAQSTAADFDKFGQSTENGFITSDGREFFVDATGNVVEVTDGTVPFEIFGGDDTIDIFNTTTNNNNNNNDNNNNTTDGPDTGHTVDDNGNKVCNTEGYVYNPATKICEPAKVTETSDDVGINIGSGTSGTSFDDVLSNVVIPAPNIAPISANIQPMKMGGMAGLNRAADNFIKALAG